MIPINYWAVLVAAIANMILGALWYGPLFGKKWGSLMGWNAESMAKMKAKGMTMSYVLMMVGSLVMAYVLANALLFGDAYLNIYGVTSGLLVGFFYWIGFVAPVTLGSVMWEGKPWTLWFINAFYYLVGLLIMGMILAAW